MAIDNKQLPCLINTIRADKFVTQFTIFEQADAFIKSKPKITTNPKTKKLPVPGPKKQIKYL